MVLIVSKKVTVKQNANSIWYSQAVTHPSTNQTQRCLTSLIGREAVCSTWYGRWREKLGGHRSYSLCTPVLYRPRSRPRPRPKDQTMIE